MIKRTIYTVTLVFALSMGTPANAAPENPNVLLIAVDELNDWLGSMGGMALAELPAWMDEYMETGARPVPDRMSVSNWKHGFEGSSLEPSGLLGPVRRLHGSIYH